MASCSQLRIAMIISGLYGYDGNLHNTSDNRSTINSMLHRCNIPVSFMSQMKCIDSHTICELKRMHDRNFLSRLRRSCINAAFLSISNFSFGSVPKRCKFRACIKAETNLSFRALHPSWCSVSHESYKQRLTVTVKNGMMIYALFSFSVTAAFLGWQSPKNALVLPLA